MRYKLTELRPMIQGYLLLIPVTYEKRVEKRFLSIIEGEVEEVSYDCECVLVKEITYEEIKKAIERTEMNYEEKKKAIGLIPKTIKILTEPKYDTSTWEGLRLYRNYLLESSDWTQLVDSKVDKQKWAEYRQKLRDLPSVYTDIREVVVPGEPSKGKVATTEPVTEPEPVAEQVAEPVAKQVAELVAEPVAESVAEQVAGPVAEPAAEPAA